MTDYKKYINALRKCAKEHENDITSLGHIIVSNLCECTADLLEELEQEPVYYPPCIDCNKKMDEIRNAYDNMTTKALEQKPILDKIRAEIKAKIEEEEFARSVFRHEEKDTAKAEQCTGSIMAYNNVIKFIDKYKTDRSVEDGNDIT